MKTESQVKARLAELIESEYATQVAKRSVLRPTSCKHNYRHPLDTQKYKDGEPNPVYNQLDKVHLNVLPTIGVCLLGKEDPCTWSGTICEDEEHASSCHDYNPIKTLKDIQKEVSDDLSDKTWLAENRPDILELSWASEDLPRPKGPGFWSKLRSVFNVLGR